MSRANANDATRAGPAVVAPVAGWLCLIGGATCVISLVAMPYLPGSYDAMAVPLSATMQLFAFTGTVPVTLGIAWIALRRACAHRCRVGPAARVEHWMASAAIVATAAALIVAGVMLAAHGSPVAWFVQAAACTVLAAKLVRRTRQGGSPPEQIARWGPRFVIIIPLAAIAARTFVVPSVGAMSRTRAMDNASTLVAAIERYHERYGEYPVSLASVHTDFRSGVKGVKRYYYESNGSAYNLYFEHIADAFDTREIVVYNPAGTPRMVSHDADRLEHTGDDLDRRSGYYAVVDTSRPNWKRFLFD